MTTPSILSEYDGDIAILRIDNPQLRNVLSRSTLDELGRSWEAVAADPSVHALIIGSAVDGIFAAGGNIRELATLEAGCADEALRFGLACSTAWNVR